jgi:hypothetical protein
MAQTINGNEVIVAAAAIGVNVGIFRAVRGNYNFTDDGGAQGAFTIFQVTGDVYIQQIYGACKTDMDSGGAATIELGIAGNTACFIAQTTATDLDQYELWQDATPEANPGVIILLGRSWLVQNGTDIILTVGAADLTAGEIVIYCNWVPLSANGNVVAV